MVYSSIDKLERWGGNCALRVLAVAVLASCLAISVFAQNASITVNIDAAANRRVINPMVYGVNFGSTSQLSDLNIPFNRSGGNNTSRYNWNANADNRASDWFFESLPYSSATAGAQGDSFISSTKAAGAEPMITIPLIDWVAKLGANRTKLCSFSIAKYGAQNASDAPGFSDAGSGVKTNGQNITGNDPNDANVPSNSTFQQGWVQHIVSRWGQAASGGVKYYGMDNESSIWFEIHRDVCPTGPTMASIRDKIIDYAGKIKATDPGAVILGPEEWGWDGYRLSGYDQQYGQQHGWSYYPERAAIGGQDYLPWLLDQLKKNETSTGKRLLDVFSVHYYPQGGEFGSDVSTSMQLRRNRSTRSLWDPNYVDESWIGTQVKLIPRLEGWVATYYPGLPVALTEYCWGADSYINGATAQADILGILGREGVDMAARWECPGASTLTYKSFKMYRNYDGNKSTFGDISVNATGPNPDNVSVFASQRSSDGVLTVMLVSKVLTGNTPATVNLSNFVAKETAQVWQLTATNTISHLPDITVNGNALSLSLPAQSITLLVIPNQLGSSTCSASVYGTDGANFVLAGKVVTAVFPAEGVIYVEESNRSAAIRIAYSGTGLAVGDKVNIAGTLSTRRVGSVSCDRQLTSTAVVRIGNTTPLRPLCMINGTIGGSTKGTFPGVGNGKGLGNMGLLVTACGRVSRVSVNDIYVDDGSGIIDPSGVIGIRVECAAAPGVSTGDFVSVTGVVVGDVPAGATANRRCIQLRTVSDLNVVLRAH